MLGKAGIIESPLFMNSPKLCDGDFLRLKDFIERNTGIKINENKKILVETRLLKRLRSLGFKSFREYCDYVFAGNDIEEIINLIDHITTNKTEFFREIQHFEFLKKEILPVLFSEKRKIYIWSSASSTGEEPYTIAMVIYDFLSKNNIKCDFSVLASDISTRVLKTAVTAIYPYERIYQVPKEYYRYFLKSKDPDKKLIRVCPEIRKYVQFKRINLLDDFDEVEKMDIIFCRNVFIYFEKKVQEEIVNKFYKVLNNGGFLFIGHSETFQGIRTNFKRVAPSIYVKGELS